MSKKAIVLLADGFEEVEAITPIDYLRRAGIAVTAAAVGMTTAVKGARTELQLIADTTLEELAPGACCFDAVIVPGGMPGAANIAASQRAGTLLKEMAAAGKLVCAICASPALVLAPLGLLKDKKFTCFPGMEEKALASKEAAGCKWLQDRVVTDGNIITSRAAGTAGEFSIAIIAALLGEDEAEKTAASVLL